MKNLMYKIIAITLVFVMIFNFSSITLAEGLQLVEKQGVNTKEEIRIIQKDETDEIEIIGEAKEKRTLNEKHYALNNGQC